MIVSASVLLPEPFGPMIACTSPLFTARSIPFRIGLPSTVTWRSLISRSGTSALLHRGLRREAARRRRLHEVREAHAVQRRRDVLLDREPHVVRRAARLQDAVHNGLALGRADLRLDRTLERAHDVARGDRLRLASEGVAAAGAALPIHQTGLAQARHELLEICLWQLLAGRDRVEAHGALSPVTREIDHETHAVLAARGNVESSLGSNSEHFTRYSSPVRIGPLDAAHLFACRRGQHESREARGRPPRACAARAWLLGGGRRCADWGAGAARWGRGNATGSHGARPCCARLDRC